MVLLATGSPLVAGQRPGGPVVKGEEKLITDEKQPASRTVKVLRPFLLKTVRQEKDAILDLPTGLAAELVAFNKAEWFDRPPVVESRPEGNKDHVTSKR